MPTDDPRVQRDDPGIQWNPAVARRMSVRPHTTTLAFRAGESRSDGGDPIAALRAHFGENAKRLSQQIEQAGRELRSLQVQHDAFIAGLQALDRPNEMPPEY
jgi:hypothetical protein